MASFMGLILLLFLHTGNCILEQLFVRIGHKELAFPGGTVIASMTVSSVVKCGMECMRRSTCLSFNVHKQHADGILCGLLSDISVTPNMDLLPIAGGLYYEKTCPVLLNPMAASEIRSTATDYVTNSVLITGDGGGTVYQLRLNSDYSIGSITKEGSVYELMSGRFQSTIGVATVHFSSGVEMKIYLIDDGVVCLKDDPFSGETDRPCFSEPVVSKTSTFGTEDVNALLSIEQFRGLYAFGYDRVRIVDVHELGPWTVSNTIDLTSDTRLSGWANVPRGVIGAAWLFGDSGGSLVFENAFFLTPHHYIVYNFVDEKNLKRGQLCSNVSND